MARSLRRRMDAIDPNGNAALDDAIILTGAQAFNAAVTFNNAAGDVDFTVLKNSSGNAIFYNAGADELDLGGAVTITGGNIDIGDNAVRGIADIFSPSASSGRVRLTSEDNAGNYIVTINNMSHGQSSAYRIPDSGLATAYFAASSAALAVSEVDKLDVSAQTETVVASGAISASTRITNLDSSGGAGAVTLAAPDAGMLGMVKIIQMTTAGNALTLALTNIQGGSAASSASFDAVDETLVLVAGTNKWTVVGEAGVTLS